MLSLLMPLAIAASCTLSLEATPQLLQLDVNGVKREATVVVGAQAAKHIGANGAAPVVFVWHGYGGSPAGMKRTFGAHLDAAIAVYGKGLPRTFPNFGKRPKPGWQIKTDDLKGRDLAFYDAMRSHLVKTGCVDDNRVTSTGFSNGGLFSNVLGCVRGETLAGIAPLSGGGPPRVATCKTPVPVLVVHGVSDRVLPFANGVRTAARWSEVNACKVAVAKPEAGSCAAASACKRPVSMCAHKLGHRLPSDMPAKVATFLLAQRRAP